jgi:hypothetical protein
MIYLEASLRVVPGKMSLNAKDVGKKRILRLSRTGIEPVTC